MIKPKYKIDDVLYVFNDSTSEYNLCDITSIMKIRLKCILIDNVYIDKDKNEILYSYSYVSGVKLDGKDNESIYYIYEFKQKIDENGNDIFDNGIPNEDFNFFIGKTKEDIINYFIKLLNEKMKLIPIKVEKLKNIKMDILDKRDSRVLKRTLNGDIYEL